GSDTVARLGGDEFALLLEDATEPTAVAIANRLLETLSTPIAIAERELVLLASIGIVGHHGGPASAEAVRRHADVGMCAPKEAGRGRHEGFHTDKTRELGELLGMEHELRLGLERGEFDVHYQQEVDLRSGAIVGVEALLRWTSPRRGAVAPDDFVPV